MIGSGLSRSTSTPVRRCRISPWRSPARNAIAIIARPGIPTILRSRSIHSGGVKNTARVGRISGISTPFQGLLRIAGCTLRRASRSASSSMTMLQSAPHTTWQAPWLAGAHGRPAVLAFGPCRYARASSTVSSSIGKSEPTSLSRCPRTVRYLLMVARLRVASLSLRNRSVACPSRGESEPMRRSLVASPLRSAACASVMCMSPRRIASSTFQSPRSMS